MTKIDSNIKRGSGELAVLTLLAETSMHGYEIAQRIERQTGGLLTFDLASLYPLLYRLEKRMLDKFPHERSYVRRFFLQEIKSPEIFEIQI